MSRTFTYLFAGLLTAVLAGPAQAVLIQTSTTATGIPSIINAQNLENQLNSQVFNPLGMEIEFGAIDGGTSAVDSMQFEGPGLTVITGFGFILRFTGGNASSVRVRFGNFKDDGTRVLRAFDHDVDYTRSTTQFSQSPSGNVLTFPDSSGSIDNISGTLPAGSTDFIDLTVTGDIAAIGVTTSTFLWTLLEIEVDTSSAAPEPGPLALFGLGLAGLGLLRRRPVA